jgi:hypothetical protein
MTEEEIGLNRVQARNLYNEALVENSLVKLERAKALWLSAKRWESYLSARAVSEAEAEAPSYSLTGTDLARNLTLPTTVSEKVICERFLKKGTLGVLIKLWCTARKLLANNCTGCKGPMPVMKWS